MQHCHDMEALEWTFQDVCDCNRPFGGVSFVFGDDLKQIPQVIFTRDQTVGSCIHSFFFLESTLYDYYILLIYSFRYSCQIAGD